MQGAAAGTRALHRGPAMPATTIAVEPATSPDDIAPLVPAYLEELTPGVAAPYPDFERYWSDRARFPYVIRHAGTVGGFALVRRHADEGVHEMAEFYIVPALRRRGIGRQVAEALFARHPGGWHLQVLADNRAALTFWAGVIPVERHVVERRASTGRAFYVVRFVAGVPAG